MTKKAAFELSQKHSAGLIGKPFDNNREGWNIVDIIVANDEHLYAVCDRMFVENESNEKALEKFQIAEDGYEAFVVSHQWSWGSGHILSQRVQDYLQKDS